MAVNVVIEIFVKPVSGRKVHVLLIYCSLCFELSGLVLTLHADIDYLVEQGEKNCGGGGSLTGRAV